MVGPQDSNNSVSLQNVRTVDGGEVDTFDFTSTKTLTAVIVKGGPDANVYTYPSGTLGGNPDGIGLSTPGAAQGISHITFCYNPSAKVSIVKQVQTFGGGTSSSQSFPFTATNLGTPNFSLVDDDAGPGVDTFTNANITAFGAGNTITVTEGSLAGLGWTLADINCSGTGTFTATTNLGMRKVDIVVQDGATVTCTFVNQQSFLTAGDANVNGRVLTASGRPIRGAVVTVFNANTLETQSLRTGSFGYFSFADLPVGHFYIVTVSHGKYAFANNTQTFTLNEDLAEVIFQADN